MHGGYPAAEFSLKPVIGFAKPIESISNYFTKQIILKFSMFRIIVSQSVGVKTETPKKGSQCRFSPGNGAEFPAGGEYRISAS